MIFRLCILVLIGHFSPYLSAQDLTKISSIHSNKNSQSLIDTQVTIQGIVNADFQSDKSFAGFFMQNKGNKKKRSSGIFVYDTCTDVSVGDLVKVTGTVVKHNGLTQIAQVKSIQILKYQQKLPKAIGIALPLKRQNLQNLIGMRVTLNQPAVISDHYHYIKYGELTVSSQLLITATNSNNPKQAKHSTPHNNNDKLLIDDGSFNQFPNHTKLSPHTPIHIGAKVQVTGVMHYAFEQYRIQLTQPMDFLSTSTPRQEQPTEIDGEIKIASFNLKNYFITLDNGKQICGPKQNFECRGADSKAEFKRQQDKLVNAINTANADIFALQELENNQHSLSNLVDALNKNAKFNKWSHIKTGVIGQDAIKVGLIYQATAVTPVADFKIFGAKVLADFASDRHRDVLLQTFKNKQNQTFNVAVLHLKSKNCGDVSGVDSDFGQGCFNTSRQQAAQQISQWLAQDPSQQNAPATVVLGDFNSYLKEDPLTTFAKNGYLNLTNKFLPNNNWSSNFRGKLGTIDHILINQTAKNAAQGLTQWHINSIEMGWFDYNLEDLAPATPKPKNYYNNSPFASSDHDMVIAGFSFSAKNQ